MTPNTHTDLALAPPAQNSENTNNPLLAVASSEIVLPDCSQDVEGKGLDRAPNVFGPLFWPTFIAACFLTLIAGCLVNAGCGEAGMILFVLAMCSSFIAVKDFADCG